MGLSFEATIYHRLSLLNLNFIIAPLSPESNMLASLIACSVFPVTPITMDLWHHRLGHLGQEATQDMLS
jgi:hypothetical protein